MIQDKFFFIVLFFHWVGVIKYLADKERKNFSWLKLIQSSLISGFCGVIAYFGLLPYDLPLSRLTAVSALCAFGGVGLINNPRLLDAIKNILLSVLKK